MPRPLSVLLVLALCAGLFAQELPFLRLKVSILDADRRPIPVARHTLLISDNPVNSPPRRVVTAADGSAEIRLRPGSYIVESDRPVVLDGRAYQWIQPVTVVSGRDTTLELTAANARAGAATTQPSSESTPAATAPVDKSTSILSTWQGSAFGLWTPHVHASGFLVDSAGLVATSRRAIGDATSVEVQISDSIKVNGAVIVADAARDVSVVRVHPLVIDGIRPVPIACDGAAAVPAAEGERYVIDVPMFGLKDISDSLFARAGAAGGPVFAGDGRVLGLSSPADVGDGRGSIDVRLVGVENICAVLASARSKLGTSPPPPVTRLPIEGRRQPGTQVAVTAFDVDAYQFSTSDFDITFVTPALIAAAEQRRGFTGPRANEWNGTRVARDFENWSAYLAGAPPLLFVRASPRMAEGFWMKVVRGAAMTQGTAIPPIKRLRPGFSRMRLVCGGQDVLPIHPFRIRSRISEAEGIDEGFYAFDPKAIGPHCGTVSMWDPLESTCRHASLSIL